MQVIKITETPNEKTISKHITLSTDVLQQEFDYWRATKILQKMLKSALISRDEYRKIDKLNRQSFSPLYAEIMPL